MVYAKKVKTTDPRFGNRNIEVSSGDWHDTITVPNDCVLCNGCNKNLHPGPGYFVYLGKRELKANQPYDIYCKDCLEIYFPKASIIEEDKDAESEVS